MNVLDLFSGIGGFSLGLERAGMRTIAFCEIDPYCRAVLRKHWPDVPIYDDVRAITAACLVADANSAKWRQDNSSCGSVQRTHGLSQGQESPSRSEPSRQIDLICGGFPCQDISVAGKGAGIEGSRSGLWSEYARIIGEVRPRYVIVENVAALLGRGLERVLGDLAALGFDAEWHCIPASAVGAPHRRDRVWIVANASCAEWGPQRGPHDDHRANRHVQRKEGANRLKSGCEDVANANQPRLEGRLRAILQECAEQRLAWAGGALAEGCYSDIARQWLIEPAMGKLVDGVSGGLVRFGGRVAKGVPNRVQKLRALGNAIVPQIAEIIGRAIMSQQ